VVRQSGALTEFILPSIRDLMTNDVMRNESVLRAPGHSTHHARQLFVKGLETQLTTDRYSRAVAHYYRMSTTQHPT
jgi:hypothetical protein